MSNKITIKDRQRVARVLAARQGLAHLNDEIISTVGNMSDLDILNFLSNELTPPAVENITAAVDEIRPGDVSRDPDLYKIASDIINNYMVSNNWTAEKITPLQWAACCMACGRFFNSRSWFRREQKNCIASNNMQEINIDAVAAAVPAWLALCYDFNKAPLICDFCEFCGISKEYIYKSGSGVTSGGIHLVQKLQEIQADGLRRRVINPRENPVGAMFLLKADHGLVEASKVQHEYIKTDNKADLLPVFDDLPAIDDKNGKNNDF